ERDRLQPGAVVRRWEARRPVADERLPRLALELQVEVDQVQPDVDRDVIDVRQPGRVDHQRRRIVGLGDERAGAFHGRAAVLADEDAARMRHGGQARGEDKASLLHWPQATGKAQATAKYS